MDRETGAALTPGIDARVRKTRLSYSMTPHIDNELSHGVNVANIGACGLVTARGGVHQSGHTSIA